MSKAENIDLLLTATATLVPASHSPVRNQVVHVPEWHARVILPPAMLRPQTVENSGLVEPWRAPGRSLRLGCSRVMGPASAGLSHAKDPHPGQDRSFRSIPMNQTSASSSRFQECPPRQRQTAGTGGTCVPKILPNHVLGRLGGLH